MTNWNEKWRRRDKSTGGRYIDISGKRGAFIIFLLLMGVLQIANFAMYGIYWLFMRL